MHKCTWLLWKRSSILPQGHNLPLPLPPSLSLTLPLSGCVCVCVFPMCEIAIHSRCHAISHPSMLYCKNQICLCAFWPWRHINTLCPGFPHPPPHSAVAIVTHQEAPSCVGACDHNFITAYKRWLCAYCVDEEFRLNRDIDHVARAGRNVFEELCPLDSSHQWNTEFCVEVKME